MIDNRRITDLQMEEREIAKSLLEQINLKVASRPIFKYNREFLVASLIKAVNKMQISSHIYTTSTMIVDQIIEQFRAILKFIYRAENEQGAIPSNEESVVSEFCTMIKEFMERYTPIRNYLDQCIIGTRKIAFDSEENLYFEESYDDYSTYARTLDKVKMFPSEQLKANMYARIGRYLSSNNFKANVFKDRFLCSLISEYVEMNWIDSEIKFDEDFGDFKYSELISFCGALKLVGDYYTFLAYRSGINYVDKSTLLEGIKRLTNLTDEKVKLFIKYQTYDVEYESSRLTLLQSLFDLGGKFYFLPISINLGLLPIKMYRLICDYDHKKYEKTISVIANKKETQMTEEIKEVLNKYDVEIVTNKKWKEGSGKAAEYDMILLDNKSKDLYILEFKWYFVGDGEAEHLKLDNRISQHIERRIEQNKYIFENKEEIGKRWFNNSKINNIHELFVSQNFSGNSKHKMPVIDYETLKLGAERFDSLKELMNYLEREEFLNSIEAKSEPSFIEFEGFKFKVYRLLIKQ